MKGFQIHVNKGSVKIQSFIQSHHFDNDVFEDEDLSFGIEGVLLNKKQFEKNTPPTQHYLQYLYQTHPLDAIKQLEGEIVGYIFDQQQKKLSVFTNFTGTRKCFYYASENEVIIDTDLPRLVKTLKANHIPYTVDEFAMYSLLVCGNTLENHTPIQQIKKLCDAEILQLDITSNQLEIHSYHQPLPSFQGTKEEALHRINEIFIEATKLEFDKDLELHLPSFALLSGGLDSRMTLINAIQEGYSIAKAFCFSQKGYWDEVLAEKIAKDYQTPFHFVSLNGGEYIIAVDDIFQKSHGLVSYTSAAHTNYAYQYIPCHSYGLIHSGQLGDGILGSFNKHPFPHPPTSEKIVVMPRLFHRMKAQFQEIIQSYDREELFLTRNVGYNRAVIGSYMAESLDSYQTSPFMHSEFIRFAQSLPEEWKYQQKIYIDWINTYQKNATQYIWERTLLKPTSHIKTWIGDKLMKRFFRIWKTKVTRDIERSNMTAYDYYFERNIQLQQEANQYFEENIQRVNFPTLKEDMILQFTHGSFTEKAAVLTVLSNFKHYF